MFLYTLTSLLLNTLFTLAGISTLVVTDEDFFLKKKGLEEERKRKVLLNSHVLSAGKILMELQRTFTEKPPLYNTNTKAL